MIEIKPQPGPQEAFLSSPADIVFYGGAAGAGKSYALLMEPLRHVDNGKFGAVCFRRESPQITSEGGLWDTSFELYSSYKAKSNQSPKHHWDFATGATITFSHLQYEKNLAAWDGSQIPLIMFDELQHFTERMFFYMLGRNRTTCGVTPYVRATCNPDPDSWLCKFLLDAGYINKKTGYPIYEMGGVIKYFIRKNNIIIWGETKKELENEYEDCIPKSFTFIPATIADNKILLEKNPEYMGNLDALLEYEKQRLKNGNWFARPTAGELFKRVYFTPIEYEKFLELDIMEGIRYWDRAATLPSDKNPDPDYTANVYIARCHDDNFYIVDVWRDRIEAGDVENTVLSITNQDNTETVAGFEQEPGASGKIEVATYQAKITDRDVKVFPKTKNKLTCWKPLARAAKNGKVFIIKAPWNAMFLMEAEAVTDGSQPGHDDMIDCAAGAYSYLENTNTGAFYVVEVK